MLHGTLWDKIPRFAVPVAATAILSQLFNAADIAVIGNFTGELRTVAVAAVGTNSSIISLIVNLFIGIALGANVTIAHAIGEKNDTMVHHAVHTSIVVAVLGGLIAAVIGELFAVPLLNQLNVPDDVFPLALLYLRIYLAGLPVILLYNFEAAVFRSVGETKIPLIALASSGVLNVLLNLFFVIVCKLDVAGVALASTIAQCVSAGLILHALTKVSDCYALDFRKVRLDLNMTKRILMLGVPAGLQNAIFAIANLFIQAGVNSFDSLMVKGNSAAANADAMVYDAMAAFYMACASFMSQNYGAGKLDRVKKSYFIALAYSFGLGAVLGGGLLVFGRQFLALFTTESAVIDAGMKRIMVMGWAYCTSAFMDCTIAASRGLGKTVGPTVIVILGSCVFRVAWVYTIFAHFHTIPALYLLYPCSWALTAAAEIAYFVFSYRHAALRLQERDALAQL